MKKIIGATLGNCVHVAGVYNFLNLAELCGYQTNFLGIGVKPARIIGALQEVEPDYLALSYRLTPEVAEKLLADLKNALQEAGLTGQKMIFGGTPAVAKVAAESGLFTRIFSGEEEASAVVSFLKGEETDEEAGPRGDTLLERMGQKHPYPLLRHHFGLPSLEETVRGVKTIAEAKVLDIISLGPDQNAQESFFRPAEMDPKQEGAGGVPLRREEDLIRIYQASRTGNYPLLRCYSGTRDLLKWAELATRTIKNAWAAIPLFWYSQLDGRADRPLTAAIQENQAAMAWYGERGIPVEVNEAHHWSLRSAPDSVAVAAFYLAAYNAKKAGVEHYIAQIMLNNPPGTSGIMDLGKALAGLELVGRLEDDRFKVYRQVRAGLASLSVKPYVAKGQLAASTVLGLGLSPQIIHVVAYCEAEHIATPAEIIESCELVHGVLKNYLYDAPDPTADRRILARKEQLITEAELILKAIRALGAAKESDPLTDPETLAQAVGLGILDAPQLKGSPAAPGRIKTRLWQGACRLWDEENQRVTGEEERLAGHSRSG
ncbi:MAG TPA: cobalamin B12-binding domain-containing protein [Firmicutes bacterium]|nr:cobalamin B12-binding domain-containing protein [Bacillota bacterium]